MYNIKALEEEWKKYDRKRKRPFYIIAFIVVLLVVVGILLLETDIFSGYIKQLEKGVPAQKVQKTASYIYVDTALNTLETPKEETTVDAPMGRDTEAIDAMPLPEETHKEEVRKKLHIEVIDAAKARTSLKEIAKRFRLGHDTDDSLFLAKRYYRAGNYKKAEYWALQTNKVNDNIEESWLLFAKAKAKRGHRNEAIRILNAYIRRTDSIEAKVLLEKIKKGKI